MYGRSFFFKFEMGRSKVIDSNLITTHKNLSVLDFVRPIK